MNEKTIRFELPKLIEVELRSKSATGKGEKSATAKVVYDLSTLSDDTVLSLVVQSLKIEHNHYLRRLAGDDQSKLLKLIKQLDGAKSFSPGNMLDQAGYNADLHRGPLSPEQKLARAQKQLLNQAASLSPEERAALKAKLSELLD